ncbi:acyltransferase [Curtobacterium sp. MCPF17_031]|uniref:acyltransferase family protein n=1 Tax=Curtobacterium sp. MCPF17_031 TaxID=2175653 RepID=UPI000DA75BD3|nr:acyltransferase [Curtobacterium sp. MCPF17_031]PZE38654.1 hypothetical protein DEJ31_05115 [Curtobacterium sp. MCPF17_031]
MNSFGQYERTRYFPQLDGLRAVSILLVLTIHSHVTQLRVLNGYIGVTVFFVLSGFLITTLLLREADLQGRVSLRNFYIRRAFRIFPLYYLVLGANIVAVAAGFADNPGDFGQRLVLFLTYLNEFASPGTFGHSWSLAIEEKFYFVWPLLAFAVPAVWRWRPWVAAALVVLCTSAGLVGGYLGTYAPIVFGCVMALAPHNPRSHRVVRLLARPLPGAILGVVVVAVGLLSRTDSHIHLAFGAAVALVLPVLLIGPDGAHAWLRWSPLRFVGQRAYAIYLVHPLVGSVIDSVLPTDTVILTVVHLVLMFAGSLVVAHVLFILCERPLIVVGRRLTGSRRAVEALPSATP